MKTVGEVSLALIVILMVAIFIMASCAKQEEPPRPAGYQHVITVQLVDNTVHKFKADFTRETNGFMYIYENGRRIEVVAIPQIMIKIVTHEEEQTQH
jgi:hypothetical protein